MGNDPYFSHRPGRVGEIVVIVSGRGRSAYEHTKNEKPNPDPGYDRFLEKLAGAIEAVPAEDPIFQTDMSATTLFEEYLRHIPKNHRQHYRCNACRRFVERYGGLVTIGERGQLKSVFWEETPCGLTWHDRAIDAMAFRVNHYASVIGPFLCDKSVLGEETSGGWRHLHARLPLERRLGSETNAESLLAQFQQTFRLFAREIRTVPIPAVERALNLLTNGSLYRSDKFVEPVRWILEVKRGWLRFIPGRERNNYLWKRLQAVPLSWGHFSNSVHGTLFDDIERGKDLRRIIAAWNAKMDPGAYQRPKAAPGEGQLDRAEKIVAELGAESALRRRYARPEDVQQFIWQPCQIYSAVRRRKTGGVFDALRKERAPAPEAMIAPAVPITWEKFQRTVLPDALSIECYVPYRGNFVAMVTAEDENAVPIIKWDEPSHRNPVSWYLYQTGSRAEQWGLRSHTWRKLQGIAASPPNWQPRGNERFRHCLTDAVFFLLPDMYDVHAAKGGPVAPWFVEDLRVEFREVRKSMEALATKTAIAGGDKPGIAGGLMFSKEGPANGVGAILVRVRSALGISAYRLDRWD